MTHNTGPIWLFDRCDTEHCFCEEHGGENWDRCCWCGSTRSLENLSHVWDARSLEDSPDRGHDHYAAFLAQLPPAVI